MDLTTTTGCRVQRCRLGASLVAAAVLMAAGAACDREAPGATVGSSPTTLCPPGAGAIAADATVEHLVVDVLEVRPHDPGAFTQGLLLHSGEMFESTGGYGSSTVRRVDPATGAVSDSVMVPDQWFGEGLAIVGDRLYQLTWQEQVAQVYDAESLQPVADGVFTYDGEGWGLCYDGERLVMSDGSSSLTFRDPETFAPVGGVSVTLSGAPVTRLNELECVGDAVYANVWMTDEIVKIDPASGEVRAVIDASGLMAPSEIGDGPGSRDAVLNGIAFDPEREVFYVTGKLWPSMFEACFVPSDEP